MVLVSCAGAPRSRWQTNQPEANGYGGRIYMVCRCDGTERQPTPSEAASFREGERVDLFCEGKVHDCRPGQLGVPVPRSYNAPFDIHNPD
jgi:hypothetical protein